MLAGVVAFWGCSAEGIEAPKSVGPFEDVGPCPGADTLLVKAKTALAAGAFDPLRPDIERILVDGAGLRTILTLVSAILPDLEPALLPDLLASLSDDETGATVDAVLPHVVEVMRYIDGSSDFFDGAHPEPMNAVHEIMTTCDAARNVAVVRDVVALEVRRTGGSPAWVAVPAGTGDASWLGALMDTIDRAQEQAAFQALLERIAIADDGSPPGEGGEIQVGRSAFVILAKLLAANIAAPDFQYAPTRQLLVDVLVPLLEDADGNPDLVAEAILQELLDLLGVLVEEQSAVFESTQEFFGCINRHDADAAIPAMLFDYLTTDELSAVALFDDLAGIARKDQSGELRVALVDVMDVLISHPVVLADTTAVLAAFAAPEVSPTMLGVVLSLQDSGILDELGDTVALLLECKALPPDAPTLVVAGDDDETQGDAP